MCSISLPHSLLTEKTLLSSVSQTRLEREGHLEWGGRSYNWNTIFDRNEGGSILSVDVLPARSNVGVAIIKANKQRMVIRAQGVIWHPETRDCSFIMGIISCLTQENFRSGKNQACLELLQEIMWPLSKFSEVSHFTKPGPLDNKETTHLWGRAVPYCLSWEPSSQTDL